MARERYEPLNAEERARLNAILDAEAAKKRRGLYEKYIVLRTDGSSGPGGKHAECRYFVLDMTHDRHARAALAAYAESCQSDYPALARDLIAWVFKPMEHAQRALDEEKPIRFPTTDAAADGIEVVADPAALAEVMSRPVFTKAVKAARSDTDAAMEGK